MNIAENVGLCVKMAVKPPERLHLNQIVISLCQIHWCTGVTVKKQQKLVDIPVYWKTFILN